MRPNADEARAAYYNAACCLTKLGRFSEAADYVKVAVNEYDLRFAVALKARASPPPAPPSPASPSEAYGVMLATSSRQDPDLLRLREQPVFDEVVSEVKGGFSQRQFIKARQEAKVTADPRPPQPLLPPALHALPVILSQQA